MGLREEEKKNPNGTAYNNFRKHEELYKPVVWLTSSYFPANLGLGGDNKRDSMYVAPINPVKKSFAIHKYVIK